MEEERFINQVVLELKSLAGPEVAFVDRPATQSILIGPKFDSLWDERFCVIELLEADARTLRYRVAATQVEEEDSYGALTERLQGIVSWIQDASDGAVVQTEIFKRNQLMTTKVVSPRGGVATSSVLHIPFGRRKEKSRFFPYPRS